MLNGFAQQTVTDAGAQQLAILGVKNGIFTRGILMDIPALKGVKYLEPRTPIYSEDLDAWEKKTGVKVGSGDVVFFAPDVGRGVRRRVRGMSARNPPVFILRASSG